MGRFTVFFTLLSLLAATGCNRAAKLQFGPIGGIGSNRLSCSITPSRTTETVSVDANGNIVGAGPVFTLRVRSTLSNTPKNSVLVRVDSNKDFDVLSGIPTAVGDEHEVSYQAAEVGSHAVVVTVVDAQDFSVQAVCSRSLTVQGVAGTLQSIAITPNSDYLPLGIFADFQAIGRYSDGSTADITESVTWNSSAPLVAEFSANAPGRLLMLSEGNVTISAALTGIFDTHDFEIGPASLQSLAIVPLQSDVPFGQSLQLIATGVFSDGSTLALTNSVTWVSSNTNLASFSTTGPRGMVYTHARGSAGITATLQGVTSNVAVINVVAPVIQAITIQPSTLQVEVGDTLQLSAIGSLSDGSTTDLTSVASWGTNSNRIQVNANGLLTGVSAGSATVSAGFAGYSTSRPVTVTQTVLNSISVSPVNPTVNENQSVALTATGTYSDGSTANLTNQVTWSSSNTARVTVANSGAGKGTATGAGEGSATITATLGNVSGSTTVTVQSRELFFVYTHKGNMDFALNDIVGANHDFSGFNFKQNQFKIKISTRLLSRINYAGKQSYELADMDLRENRSTYAEIYRINRNTADRATGSGSCTAVPENVFERHRFDSSTLAAGSYLNLASGSGNQYIYEHEARERFAVSNQGCYPSVHSGRKDAWGTSIAAPNFNVHPWPYDGYSNTYANGAFVYVTSGGQLRFSYTTQQQAGRVVFLVAIKGF